jgi:hypothetical protein
VSIQVVGWALEYQDLPLDKRTGRPSSSAKLVLIALANHADRDGANCFPAVDTICWYTGLSERAVQYTLRELEGHGVIRKTPNPLVLEAKVDDPRKRPQSYDIVVFAKPDAVQPSAPSQGRVRRVRGAKSTGSRGAKSATSLHPNRPVTVLTPEPSMLKDSAIAASSLRDDGQGVFVQDRNKDHKHEGRSYPAEWDAEDEARRIAEDRTERLLDRLASDPDIVWFEGCEETMARSMFGRGECYEYVKNKILKDRHDVPV